MSIGNTGDISTLASQSLRCHIFILGRYVHFLFLEILASLKSHTNSEEPLAASSIRHKRSLRQRGNSGGLEQACEPHEDLRFPGEDESRFSCGARIQLVEAHG